MAKGRAGAPRAPSGSVGESGVRAVVSIASETEGDGWEIEALYDLSFAPGRHALSSYQLREGVDPVAKLCLTARDRFEVLLGAIRFWPVRIGEDPSSEPALLLGPIAVHPTAQGEGVGAALIFEGLERAAALGWRRVLLVGDAPYYTRFGFEPIADRVAFPPPVNPNRVLARALVPGGLEGVAGAVRRWRVPGAPPT